MWSQRARLTPDSAAPESVSAHTTGSRAPIPVLAAGNAAVARLIRRLSDSDGADAPPGFADALRAAGGGHGIPSGPRGSLEAGLGVPLDGVRLHVGESAATLSRQVNAAAFTVGQDVYFGAGSYDPGSASGYHLLAHEVVHTLQPGSAPATSSLVVGASDAPAEREAEAIATQLTTQRQHPDNAAPPQPVATGTGANRTIRRWGREEHQTLGDTTGATIDLGGGLVLNWGDIVALAGDEFGSVQDIKDLAATPAGQAELRRMLSTGDHSPQYVNLAMHNIPHFSAGGTARVSWQSHHEPALVDALMSGLDADEPLWQNAQLTEAFGEHFLTDSFSAGHVRTPRSDIIAWYQGDFAPRALPPFIAAIRQRIKDELVRQVGPQMNLPNAVIGAAVDALMGGALAWYADEIHDQFEPLFGLGISGAVSGVLHDTDNEQGLWLTSDAHPEPWLGYGDGRLACSPTSAEQAGLAVAAARGQLLQARELGRIRREQRGAVVGPGPVGTVPTTVGFTLDSSTLDAAATTALATAADYLVANSEQVVDILGHTCPLGTDVYNDGLGMRRAEAVAAYLMGRGIAANRIQTASAGEHQLLTAAVAGYPLDRRAELTFRAAGDAPPDLVWAQQIINERFPGPPYTEVEQYIPREAAGRNDPQEDWHWGTMTSSMAAEIDRWIIGYVGGYRAKVAADPRLASQTIVLPDISWTGGVEPAEVTVEPRPAALAFIDDLLSDPTGFVGRLVGIPAANRSTTPLPPAVPCRP